MSRVLHKAIRDALRDTPAYEARAIAVSAVLEATADLEAEASILYDAVHRLFAAMPARLVRGSVLLITTQDAKDATELAWDAREDYRETVEGAQTLTAGYKPDEPIALALTDLERFCQLRAGYVHARVQAVRNSSSFERPAYVHRRVIAHLPRLDAALAGRVAHADAAPSTPHVTSLPTWTRKDKPFDSRPRAAILPRVSVASWRR